MTALRSPATQRCLRSAAEDLRLSLDGWVEVPAMQDDTRCFGHRDNEALLITVRCAGNQWEWSAASALPPGAQQPWCRVHEQGVEVCDNERTALLSALHLAGDDMREAAGCATATLHARLETITRHRGLDLFVTPAEPGGGAAPDPATPRPIIWAITARDEAGNETVGEVRACGEHEARMAYLRGAPAAEVLLIEPRLAVLPTTSPEARAALRHWLVREAPGTAALLGI
ncbi:hypothetical protein [Roseomonas mucosa]|uniref:hypothetical protein n=1 Tax=Roseomonas mucosa TaxID=207340 RepID=UPI00324DA8CF